MLVRDLDYDLDDTLIARTPPEARDGGRLLLLGTDGSIEHRAVRSFASLVSEGALLVVNDTRVINARLVGRKPGSGGRVEVFLVERGQGEPSGRRERWRALIGSSKPVRIGTTIVFDAPGFEVEVLSQRDTHGLSEVVLTTKHDLVAATITRVGEVPLPPYMKRRTEAADAERYQTVYAREPGAVAAPTAGLHLTNEIFEELRARSVEVAPVTLHVSLGTFAPIKVDDLDEHPMHSERFVVSDATARAIAKARAEGREIIAVGTTSVRVMESAVNADGAVEAGEGTTRLLIQPGYRFRVVDGLLTNFHLPRSTLLALVYAAGGAEAVREAYRVATLERYRFFSYGDAMFLQPTMRGRARCR